MASPIDGYTAAQLRFLAACADAANDLGAKLDGGPLGMYATVTIEDEEGSTIFRFSPEYGDKDNAIFAVNSDED